MPKIRNARRQAEIDIRLALKGSGRSYLEVSHKQWIIFMIDNETICDYEEF